MKVPTKMLKSQPDFRLIWKLNKAGCTLMGRKQKNILAVAGVISTVLGIVIVIPTFLQENYVAATGAIVLMVGGLVMLAIAFGE